MSFEVDRDAMVVRILEKTSEEISRLEIERITIDLKIDRLKKYVAEIKAHFQKEKPSDDARR